MTVSQVTPPAITPDPKARQTIEELSHQKLTACYQCQKCTNGCPVSSLMDIAPHRTMHMLHLGMLDGVLRSKAIWLCASCQTCTTRCPNGIDIARVMDGLRRLSREQGKASEKEAILFNAEFLSSVKTHGRLHELGMITRYTIRSQGLMGLLKQTTMGLNMFKKGKLKLVPHSFRPDQEVRAIFRQAEREKPKK